MNDITFDEAPAVPETHTIGEALRNVWSDPGQFIKNWNYKGAVLSGVVRAPIFLFTYLAGRESLKLAIGAAAVQFAFRFAFAGVGGTLIQGYRKVEPAWKALAAIMLILPLIGWGSSLRRLARREQQLLVGLILIATFGLLDLIPNGIFGPSAAYLAGAVQGVKDFRFRRPA